MNGATTNETTLPILILIGAILAVVALVVFLSYRMLGLDYTLSEMGRALKESNYQKIIDLGMRYFKRSGPDFWIFYYLAQAFEGINQFQKAIEHFEKALVEIEKSKRLDMRIEVLLKLGLLYRRIRRPNDAVAYFHMVLKDNGRNSIALTNMGEIFYESKNFAKARGYLETLVEVKPKLVEPRYILAKIYNKMAEYQRSIVELDAWFEMKDEKTMSIELYNESLMLLADNYFAVKRYNDAINILKPLLNDDSLRVKVLYKIVLTYVRTSEAAKAIQTANEYLPKIQKEERYGILYEVGQAYLGFGDIYKAIEAWQSAYEINPKYRDLAETLRQYDILIQNRELAKVFTTDQTAFQEYMTRKLKLNTEGVIARDKEFVIFRDNNNNLCHIVFLITYPVTVPLFERIEDVLNRSGLSNVSVNIYSLFGIEIACKGRLFYKRVREFSEKAFVNFFKTEK